MSRRNQHDNLNAVQLFPFVAVLLCTMGSLLVLLVGVARSSRNQALDQLTAKKAAAAAAAPAAPPVDDGLRRKLDEVAAFVGQLDVVRTKAQRQLHDDQLQLSHLEDHIRRLHDRLGMLQIAATELNAQEGTHYDDRAQAERELARLEQLIVASRQGIEELRQETRSKKRAVAILPQMNAKGTRRPPIYLECRGTGVYLQPEGIQFTRQDFLGPPGPNSPLAAALRAAREHLIKENPDIGTGDEAEPYALVVARPDGLMYFRLVCQVLQQAGLDFGYELIGADWDLKYPTASPRLASVEYQAVALARDRMQMMASAAPRMYGEDRQWTGEFEDADEGSYGGAAPADRRPPPGRFAGRYDKVDPDAQDDTIYDTQQITPTNPDTPEKTAVMGEKNPLTGERPEAKTYITGQMTQPKPPNFRPLDEDENDESGAKARGKDWAIKRMPGTVPIRRTIQVVVREDRLAILPEPSAAAEPSSADREIVLRGSTGASINQFVAELKQHMAEWGIAGQGLAWRPVLELKVGPDGQQRADDVARLLRNSGIEVKTSSVAQHSSGEPSRASR